MQQNEAFRQGEERFREFMDVTFLLSEEELQAIHGLIPMTQELFGRCMRRCEEIGAPEQMAELIAGFPSQYRAYRRVAESCAEETFAEAAYVKEDAKIPAVGSAQSDVLWQKIRAQLGKPDEVAFSGEGIV